MPPQDRQNGLATPSSTPTANEIGRMTLNTVFSTPDNQYSAAAAPNQQRLYKRDHRMNQGTFAICWILLQVPALIAMPLIFVFAAIINMSNSLGIVLLIFVLLAFIYLLMLEVRIIVFRLWDMNKNAFLTLLYIIPLVNIALLIWMAIAKSYPYDTKHGPVQSSNIQISKMFRSPKLN